MIAQLDPLYIRTRPGKALVRVQSHLLFQGRFVTTKHRWLNRFLLAELACLKRFPQLKSVEKPIFIVGTGRSGSTILGKVLSMHRDLGFLDEPKVMWYTIDPREDVNGHFNRGPALYRFNSQDVTPELCEAAHRLFGAYLTVTRSKRVLDKNPEIVYRIPFVRTIFSDAKFIFLVRNGWDTISSITMWSKLFGRQVKGEIEDWWGVNQRKWRFMVAQLVPTEPLLTQVCEEIKLFTRHEDMAAVEWIVTMQEGLRFMQSLSTCIYLLRYEDLTQHPQDTLEKLLAFCELSEDAVFLSYAQQVLEPVPHKRPPNLSSIVHAPFLKTMRALNYPVEAQT
jgi:hypothetical protein